MPFSPAPLPTIVACVPIGTTVALGGLTRPSAASGPAGRRLVRPGEKRGGENQQHARGRHFLRRRIPQLGWRVAIQLSAVVVLIGYYIRTKVTGAPIFV